MASTTAQLSPLLISLKSDSSYLTPDIFRYGLIGLNGCGKSTLMSTISNREFPIPDHVDIFHVTREIAPTSKTALECVMEVDEERLRLEAVGQTDERIFYFACGKSLPMF